MEFLRISSTQFASALNSFQQPRKHYSYGTAGFRDRYDETVHSIFYKVGIIAALRSLSQGGQAVGVMVTASHNALPDNGVKIVDANGGMMSQAWEGFAEQVVNLHDLDAFVSAVQTWIDQDSTIASSAGVVPIVVIGRDCRYHSPILSELVMRGVKDFTNSNNAAATIIDIGEVTTPVVHFVVADYNSTTVPDENKKTFSAEEWKKRYFQTLSKGYQSLIQTSPEPALNKHETLVLDCAFGVGSKTISEYLTETGSLSPWTLNLINLEGTGEVNKQCGAEHVQKGQIPPHGLQPIDIESQSLLGKLLCSFDGDGDRIVFHAYLNANQWILLDGDRIATLIALFLFQELTAAELLNTNTDLRAGVVQTAYANGSSGQFLRNKGVEVLLAKTGVKFIHHKAEELDIGIYFEANGHGTVLFSDRFKSALLTAISQDSKENARKTLALDRLQASLNVVNQTVGDALSDLLFSLAILKVLDLSYEDWNAFYTELPSKQVKLAVPDKSLLKCSEDETFLVEPSSLQEALNAAMASVNKGRCFVRPSGTEDVVRIYAEAETTEEVEKLTELSRQAIHAFYA